MRVLMIGTPVGPIGSGIGGGVELTLRTIADGLARRGHGVTVLAPRGSRLPGHELLEVDGALHVPSQTVDRGAPLVVPADSVLAAMWGKVVEIARRGGHDVVLNLAYDALPFERRDECPVPVAHLVSMGSLSEEMDRVVRATVEQRPGTVAMHSRAQAETFGAGIADAVVIVAGGIELDRYEFVPNPGEDLAFVARISREKGVDDAFAVAEMSGRRLLVFGVMEDPVAWREAASAHPRAAVEHVGFLPTSELQRRLGRCAALIMVHRWVEAFGNVAIEALACGVPVITYDRGGPAEIVEDGATGFVVPVDDPAGVVAALGRIASIDRGRCRSEARRRFSAQAFVERVEGWLTPLIRGA